MAASPTAAPRPLRVAALLTAVEGAGLVVAGLVQLGLTAFGDPEDVGRALFVGVFAVLVGIGLVLLARALDRRRRAARTPVVVVQLLALPVGYSLTFDADRVYVGLPLLVLAVVILLLLFTPESLSALDRS